MIFINIKLQRQKRYRDYGEKKEKKINLFVGALTHIFPADFIILTIIINELNKLVMNLQPYPFSRKPNNVYEFESIGRWRVKKVVELQETDQPGIFNLAMGDEIGGVIRYDSRTNNNDLDKVMETVGDIIKDFTLANPRLSVLVTGDQPAKTRLYQMYLSNNLDAVLNHFKVRGVNSDRTNEMFTKDKNYAGFLVKRK